MHAMALAIGCSAPAPADPALPDAAIPRDVDAFASESANEDWGREGAADDEDGAAPGDATGALEVTPAAFTEENAPMRLLGPDDTLELMRAPQGGHVVLLAAQIRNANTSAATIRVRVRRPDTGFIVAEEKRTVAMVPVPGEPATRQPDLRSRSQVAHVPLCPDYDPIDIVAQPLDVEFEVTTLYTEPPQTGSARLRLLPTCRQTVPEEKALCQCECEANYALGKCKSGPPASESRRGTPSPSRGTP
jgi:hypothetical protein